MAAVSGGRAVGGSGTPTPPPPPPLPTPESTPESLAAAMAALSAAGAPRRPTGDRPPAEDLLAAALGKVGGCGPVATAAVKPAAARAVASPASPSRHAPAPPSGASLPADPQDLIAAALGKAGVKPLAKPAAPTLGATLGATGHSSALDAYKSRHYDGTAGENALGEGTLTPEVRRARERAKAERAEASYRNKHSFVGEHYNDI